MVVAKPVPAVIERDDEEVLGFQLFEHARRVVSPEDRVAQRPAHALEHGAPQHELELVGAHVRKLLGPQVVGDEPVVASERRERRVASERRERRKIEPRGPALGALVQGFGLGLGQVDPRCAQELIRLGVAEGERCGAELEELSVGPELGEPHLRPAPTGEHELRARRHMGQKRRQDVEAVGLLELVHVVQDEHDRVPRGRERRAEAGQRALPREAGGRLECLEHGRFDTSPGAECLRHIGEEEHGVVVPVIERDPGKGAPVLRRPLAENRGLAVPGRCHDADEAAIARSRESMHEARPLDETGSLNRNVQLRLQRLEYG